MPDEPLLTIKEVASLLKLSERTAYAMAKEGRLPGAMKVGGRGGLFPRSCGNGSTPAARRSNSDRGTRPMAQASSRRTNRVRAQCRRQPPGHAETKRERA